MCTHVNNTEVKGRFLYLLDCIGHLSHIQRYRDVHDCLYMQTSGHQMKTYNQTQLHDLGLQAIKQDNENYNKKYNSGIIDKLDC